MYFRYLHAWQPCRQEDTPQPHRKGSPQTVVLWRSQPVYQHPEHPLYFLGLAAVLQPTQRRYEVVERRRFTLCIPPLVQEHIAQPRAVRGQIVWDGLDHTFDGLRSCPAAAAIIEHDGDYR